MGWAVLHWPLPGPGEPLQWAGTQASVTQLGGRPSCLPPSNLGANWSWRQSSCHASPSQAAVGASLHRTSVGVLMAWQEASGKVFWGTSQSPGETYFSRHSRDSLWKLFLEARGPWRSARAGHSQWDPGLDSGHAESRVSKFWLFPEGVI